MTMPFTRDDLARAEVKLQRNGRLFNARVTKVTLDGKVWTVKDFSDRPFYVRWVARFLLARELKALQRLKGIDGFAEDAFRLDADCMAVRYIDGRILLDIPDEEVTPEFLTQLENLTRRMHEAGIVHLDIRSKSNVLMRPDGTPAIIDFQAGLCTDAMPRWLKKLLEDIDISGAYKKWREYHPESMGEYRKNELERINGIRRFWVLKGYFGLKKKKPTNNA